jgi:hypothetical protein
MNEQTEREELELEWECEECASYIMNRISIEPDNYILTEECLTMWLLDHFKQSE